MDSVFPQPPPGKHKRVSLADWARPARASDFLIQLPQLPYPAGDLLGYARVSTSDQDRAGNQRGQVLHLPAGARERGWNVLDVLTGEWSGRGRAWPEELERVLREARERGCRGLLF